MPRSFDEHNFRDVGGPENLHVRDLSEAEREKAEKRRTQEMAEAYKKSVAARRETVERTETAFQGALDSSGHILTPEQEQHKRLQLLKQPDGSLMHVSLAKRRAAQREHEENYAEGSPTPEETAAFMREVEEEAESEESFWGDIESE
jgi:hypothetical protein